MSRHVGPDGKIMHAELKIGDSHIMVNDVMPGMKGPKAFGGSPASLWLYVENCDALFNRAVSAGAKVQMPMADQFWGDRAGRSPIRRAIPGGSPRARKISRRPRLEQRATDFFKQMAQPTTR